MMRETAQAAFDNAEPFEDQAKEQGKETPDLKAKIHELAKLSEMDYEQRREDEAKRLKVRVSKLDAWVLAERGEAAGAPTDTPVEDVDPWPEAVDGRALAEDVRDAFLRHVVFPSDADANAATLWIFGTYLMDTWRLWPKLLINSPEKRCGKSTLLEVIEAHVARALMCSNISTAALFRCIEKWRPTVIIDEADRFLRQNEEANGIINAGHTRRSATVVRTVEQNRVHEPRKFSVWAAQAIAGIGTQADTLEDRSVRVSLRRRLAIETVAELSPHFFEERQPVRQRLARWADDQTRAVEASNIRPPDCGNSRARDNWQPLWRIAEVLGGPWPDRAASAYILKEAESEPEEESAGVMLLKDIMDLFDKKRTDRLQSADIVEYLTQLEDRPWPEWRNAKPITQVGMARQLKPFKVHPSQVRFGTQTLKGYARAEVAEAAERYAASQGDLEPETAKHESNSNDVSANRSETTESGVSDPQQNISLKYIESFGVSGSGACEDGEL